MNSKLLILLSLVFAGLLLNSYFLSQNSLEKHEKQQKRRFMLRDSEELFKVEWESFESLAQPSYVSEEEENFRKETFCKNAEEVMNLNDEANGKTRYTINLNSDKTQEELQNTKFGIKLDDEYTLLQMEQYEIPELQQIATTIDWRKALPAKTKNQGACGSCWAFAAGQAVEGIRAAQDGVIEEISIQHILDCTNVDNGCNGYSSYHALQMTAEKGVIREDLHPYIGRDQNQCPLKTKLPFKNAGVEFVGGDCNKLKSALQQGPIVVYLAAGSKFMQYSSGVLEDLTSTVQQINHAVLLVGYTPDYWIIRNSWGEGYGMKGYSHIKMGNHAQICVYAFQATKDPKYTSANGIKPSFVINQDSIVIDNTPKIDFNKMVDKSFTVAFDNSACSKSLGGLGYLQIQDDIFFQPKSQTYVAKVFSKIDFLVTGIQFAFVDILLGGTFIVNFEQVEGGKAKALALKYDDQFFMIQCTLTTGAPQAVLNKCSGRTDKTFVFYRADYNGILNDDCTFGLTQTN